MKNLDIQELLSPPSLSNCKKVLCVQPHPDDNDIGMGGIIAKLAANGCEIHYLTVTDGRLGDMGTDFSPDQLAEIRQLEAEAAGRKLGANKFFWLYHKDGSLNDVPALANEIAEIIRQEQYDTLFCPDPWLNYEAHYDHIVTGRACAQAAISCSLKSYPEETTTSPCQLNGVGFYFTASPNVVEDITEFFDLKFEAIALHKTQVDEYTLQLYRTYFTMRGQQLTQSDRVGEGLKMLRSIHLHCIPEAESL